MLYVQSARLFARPPAPPGDHGQAPQGALRMRPNPGKQVRPRHALRMPDSLTLLATRTRSSALPLRVRPHCHRAHVISVQVADAGGSSSKNNSGSSIALLRDYFKVHAAAVVCRSRPSHQRVIRTIAKLAHRQTSQLENPDTAQCKKVGMPYGAALAHMLHEHCLTLIGSPKSSESSGVQRGAMLRFTKPQRAARLGSSSAPCIPRGLLHGQTA